MKDCVGNEVTIGDEIMMIIPSYSSLARGLIVKVNPKSITAEYYNPVYTSKQKTARFPDQFVKVIKE